MISSWNIFAESFGRDLVNEKHNQQYIRKNVNKLFVFTSFSRKLLLTISFFVAVSTNWFCNYL